MSALLKTHSGKIDLVYIDPPFNTGQDFSFSKTRTASISNSKSDELAYSDSFKLDEYLKFMQECFKSISYCNRAKDFYKQPLHRFIMFSTIKPHRR